MAFHDEELFGMPRRGKDLQALSERDQAIGRAVRHEDRRGALADLRQIVKAIADQPARRQPGELLLSHDRN